MRVHRSVKTSAPTDRVWRFLVEPERILEWCVPIKKLCHTSAQHSGVGATFYFEETVAGRLMKLNFVVTEWVENQRVAFSLTSGNFVKGYEQQYTLESNSSGCRLTCKENIKLPYGILGTVAGLFARFGSEAHVKDMLFKLKNMAEA